MYKSTNFPITQLNSFKEFCASGRKKTIQEQILYLLEKAPHGLSRREISHISEIEIPSLTFPLQALQRSGKLTASDTRKDTTTKRYVLTYKLVA